MRDDELEAGASRKPEADEDDARASEDRQTDMLPKERVAGRSGGEVGVVGRRQHVERRIKNLRKLGWLRVGKVGFIWVLGRGWCENWLV